ncbi:unnamed protein product [Chrysoparadoxa australica]
MLRPPWFIGKGQGLKGGHSSRAVYLNDGLPSQDELIGAAKETWLGFTGDPKTDLGLEFESVKVPLRENGNHLPGNKFLRGWLVRGKDSEGKESGVAVVAVHGGGRDRRQWLRHTPMLHEVCWIDRHT